MLDVLIVGAGPAGAVAATLLARAGVSVRLLDRARFPREKLCGDTLNPGAVAALDALAMDPAGAIARRGLPVEGMIVTGTAGSGVVEIRGRYPRGLRGRAIGRADLDAILVETAVAAGARFDPEVAVRAAVIDGSGHRGDRVRVAGVQAADVRASARAGGPMAARVVVAADGRRSTLAFGLGLARHPMRPRRWAIGAYMDGVRGVTSFGEMHVRPGRYIGIAAVPNGATNVCLVTPSAPGDPAMRDPAAALLAAVAADPALRDRFAGARLIRPPVVLGPLAVESVESVEGAAGFNGLLVAGDAAGFVDPMTGDGLRFAVRGGALAAAAALDALAHGWDGVHARHARACREELAGKYRFNRALRALVGAPRAVRAAAVAARVAPWLVEAVIARAGDCDAAGLSQAPPAAARAWQAW